MTRPADILFPENKARKDAGLCPICGQPITEFRDALSHKEFQISGMCQECQDLVFNNTNDED